MMMLEVKVLVLFLRCNIQMKHIFRKYMTYFIQSCTTTWVVWPCGRLSHNFLHLISFQNSPHTFLLFVFFFSVADILSRRSHQWYVCVHVGFFHTCTQQQHILGRYYTYIRWILWIQSKKSWWWHWSQNRILSANVIYTHSMDFSARWIWLKL